MQKFRCSSCGHVFQRPLIQSVREDLVEVILEMLRTFVREMDDGKKPEEAGWTPFNDNILKELKKIDFCEIDYENRVARVNPRYKLPDDIASTDEGILFSDYLKALRVLRTIEKIKCDDKKYRKAIMEGLLRMLKTAQYNFWEKEEGTMPIKIRQVILNPQRMRIIRQYAYLLVKELLKTLWKADTKVEGLEEVTNINSDHYMIIKKALKWDKIIEFFCKSKERINMIKDLGLIWYIDQEIEREGIEHLGARVLVLERIISRSELENLDKMLEELEKFISKNSWEVDWSGIFRLPY